MAYSPPFVKPKTRTQGKNAPAEKNEKTLNEPAPCGVLPYVGSPGRW